jgi:ATP-dependent DNA helicase RecG
MDTNKQLDLFENGEWSFLNSVDNAFPNNEYSELEYKSAQGGFPSEFWKTYSAFANSNGGLIVFGVSEKKGILYIDGLDEDKINSLKKIFWDKINNLDAVSCNLLSDDDVKIVEVKDKKVLVFKIPSAKRTQRPVHLSRNPYENTYKRNHEGDYKCTREEVRRMIADADTIIQHDSRILEGFSMDDIDPNSLRKYRQLFAGSKPSHPWLALDDKELLEKLGSYRKDRVSKKEGLTVAGLLMFGNYESITDQECVPNFFPDFREMLSNDPNIRWTDRIYPDGTWEANLFQFYLKIWPRLSSNLPKPFQLKDGLRQDDTQAHIALREAFVNALIHTDYTAPGSIIIEHKTNNFIFSNPGTLLMSLQQYYHGGISECRNPNLQKMFLMMGSAEKAGSGVNKIMAGWESAHWRTPYLQVNQNPDRLILELPMFSIIPEETLLDLRNRFGDEVDALGKDELTILATCRIEGEISNSRLQFMINKHRTDITKILQELCKNGYLIADNKGRWTTYHLNTDFSKSNMITLENKVDTSSNKLINSEDNKELQSYVDTSNEKVDTSNINVDTSANILTDKLKTIDKKFNMDTSGANMDTSGANMDTSDGNQDIQVSKTVKLRMKKEDLETLILEVCNLEFKSLDDIGPLVNKTPKYLKNYIIPDLVKSGKLERLYPTINHPNQAYKSAGK